MPCLDWRPLRRNSASATSFQNTSIISTSIFSATPTTISKLKQDASPAPVPLMAPNGQKAAGGISTKDALGALLWRRIMKARFPSQPVTNMRVENYNSVIAVAMDGRKSLAIPIDYVGNVVFESMTELLLLSSRQRPVSLQSPPSCMDLSKRVRARICSTMLLLWPRVSQKCAAYPTRSRLGGQGLDSYILGRHPLL